MYSEFYFNSKSLAQQARRLCHAAGGFSEGIFQIAVFGGCWAVRVPYSSVSIFARVAAGLFYGRSDSFNA